MAYKFRFYALLKYRQYLLTQAQTNLATAMSDYEAARTVLENTTAERDQNILVFQEKQRSGMKASEYHLFKDYFVSLERQLLELERGLQELAKEVEDAKGLLLKRERELKMMEILDAKDQSVFRKEQSKREQVLLDERAIIGDFRKKVGL